MFRLHRTDSSRRRLQCAAFVFDDGGEDLVEGAGGLPAEKGTDAGDIGDATLHVFETGGVGLGEGDEHDFGGAAGEFQDALGQGKDGDLFGATDVVDASGSFFVRGQTGEGADDIADVTEASALGAIAVDRERFASERLLNEARDDHAVLAGLAGADGIKEARADDIGPELLVIGQTQELIHCF